MRKAFTFAINRTYCIKNKQSSPAHIIRVLSLRSSAIHGFVTEPWYSHHVRVFMWARRFECARVCVPCFMLERGVWIPGPALMSWVSVTWRGSDTRAPFSVIVCARSRAVHVCFVVLHAVRVSIGCVHLCYILCCVARSLYIHWLRAFMLSCLVWTRGLWVFSLAACSCPVLHMAGDLFAVHVLVFLFCEHVASVLVFCVPRAHVNLSWSHPSCYLFIDSFSPAVFPRYPHHLLPL